MRCLKCHRDGISTSAEVCPECGVHLPSLLRDVLPAGTLLRTGAYRVDYALGRGGFGITYRGMHVSLEQTVAIKEFYPQEYAVRESATGTLMVPSAQSDAYQRALERFTWEGKILAGLNHPGIVRVSDLFEERGTAYLVMDLITGRTLRNELDIQPDHRLSPIRVEEIVNQLVNALEAIHQADVCHLDIKPDNVLVTATGRIILVDFGAARQGFRGGTAQPFTLEYTAPEILNGQAIGPASDLFELGMMAYEMLTGQRPTGAIERLQEDTWTPSGLNIPWQNLLTEALRLRPDERPSSVKTWWELRSIGSMSSVSALPDTKLEEPARPGLTIISAAGLRMEFVQIPAGPYLMGSEPAGDKAANQDEKPQHPVYLSDFYMAKTPVTNAQFDVFVKAKSYQTTAEKTGFAFVWNGSTWAIVYGADWRHPGGPKTGIAQKPDHPVVQVSWHDAVAFCDWLSEVTEQTVRLPTEAQWEKAARVPLASGRSCRKYPWGDMPPTHKLCNFHMNVGDTTTVSDYAMGATPSTGILNMAGNVWEWCGDWYNKDYYDHSPERDPIGPEAGKSQARVLRGGSWNCVPRDVRATVRSWLVPTSMDNSVGFRCVRY